MKFLKLAVIGLLGLAAGWLFPQDCTPTAPCTGLTFFYPSFPATDVILSCTGSSTTCSQAALNYFISKQTITNVCPKISSVWKCVAFTQTKSPQGYNLPFTAGSTMNFSFQQINPASPIQQVTPQ